MSAAEKLRALEFGRAGYPGVGHIGDETIIAALSQIIAVVEAAEQIVKFGEEEFREGEYSFQFVLLARPALAALDESLGTASSAEA